MGHDYFTATNSLFKSSYFHQLDTNQDGYLNELLEMGQNISALPLLTFCSECQQSSEAIDADKKQQQILDLNEKMTKMYNKIAKIQQELTSQSYETSQDGVQKVDKEVGKLMALQKTYSELEASIIEQDLNNIGSGNKKPTPDSQNGQT